MHWIDLETFARRMTVLACRRVVGSQTFDVLGKLLSDINKEYAIHNKVISTTTDNGSNFVKSFRYVINRVYFYSLLPVKNGIFCLVEWVSYFTPNVENKSDFCFKI